MPLVDSAKDAKEKAERAAAIRAVSKISEDGRIPNLGDVTQVTDEEWKSLGHIDCIVGGSPCQAFSVAGLRKGLKDARGNLTLEYLRIVDLIQPDWFVWENVPGFLSIEGGDVARMYLDLAEDMGYVVDFDILDAQFFGVPQRRRRVFICGQRVETLLQSKTITSALTTAQCLAEISQSILVDHSSQFENEPALSDKLANSRDGLQRRMKLFGLEKDANLEMLLKSWDAAMPKSAIAPELLAYAGASATVTSEAKAAKPVTFEANQESASVSWSTEKTWPHIWGAVSAARRLSTTLTATTPTTTSEIYTCSMAVLHIARLIAQSNASCPSYWSAGLSALTALKEFTSYARSASSGLFRDPQWFQAWSDFIGQAEPAIIALGDIGIRQCGSEVLPLRDCLQGHPPPSRKAGQGTTHELAPSLTGSGRGTERTGESRGQDPVIAVGIGGGDVGFALRSEASHSGDKGDGGVNCTLVAQTWPADVAPTLNAHFGEKQGLEDQHIRAGQVSSSTGEIAHCLNAGGMGRQDFETETLLAIGGFPSSDIAATLSSAPPSRRNGGSSPTAGHMIVTHALRGEGFDASEDGTGQGTPIIAIQGAAIRENPASGPDGVGVRTDGIAYTLEARSEVQAIAFRTAGDGNVYEEGDNTAPLTTATDPSANIIAFTSKDHGADASEISPTLRSMGHDGSHANGGGQVAIAFVQNTRDEVRLMGGDGGVAGALAAEPGMKQQCYVAIQNATRGKEQNGLGVSDDGAMHTLDQGSQHGVAIGWSEELTASVEMAGTVQRGGQGGRHEGVMTPTMAVRRLTPRECERLMGFPDNFLDVLVNGKKLADGPKYKMCGNSFAVPCVVYVGERIEMAHKMTSEVA